VVNIKTWLSLYSNHDCHSKLKGLDFYDSGGFVTINKPVTVYTTKISLVAGNTLSAGTAIMRLKEMCWMGDLTTNNQHQSIGLGLGESEAMAISQIELKTLTAATLFIESELGSMIVHGIDQATDLPNVSIQLTIETKHSSNQKITFKTDETTLTNTNIDAAGGIIVDQHLTATETLTLTFANGYLDIKNVELKAHELKIDIGGDGIKISGSSATLESTSETLTIAIPLEIQRSSNEQTVRLISASDIACKNTVTLIERENIVSSLLEISSETASFSESCAILAGQASDMIWVHPTCSGENCNMLLGDHPDAGALSFHLTNDELDMVTTSGILYLGGRNQEVSIDEINFAGVVYSNSERISVTAYCNDFSNCGQVTISGDTTFSKNIIFSTKALMIQAVLTTTNVAEFFLDLDCNDGHLVRSFFMSCTKLTD
jgi:hypothetical protein